MNILSKMIYKEVEKIVDKNKDLLIENLKNKSILITGASGLIGVNLIACLHVLNKKYDCEFELMAINKNELLKDLYNFKACRVSSLDLTKEEVNFKADIIIHAATYGQPKKFLNEQLKTIKLNTTTVFNLFEHLNYNGKFLYLSSSEVYNEYEKDKILPYEKPSEKDIGNTTPYNPRACYIEGKRCGETIVNSYKNMFDVKTIRLALAYGMGTKSTDERVLNAFIRKGIQEKKIEVLDSGTAIRSYIYISDVIELLWKILFTGKENLYNIGGQEEISIKDLAKMIGKILNVPYKLSNKSHIEGSPNTVLLNINKIIEEFNPIFTPLDIGLKKTIKWQKNLYK